MTSDITTNFYILSFSYKSMPLEERENFVRSKYKTVIETPNGIKLVIKSE